MAPTREAAVIILFTSLRNLGETVNECAPNDLMTWDCPSGVGMMTRKDHNNEYFERFLFDAQTFAFAGQILPELWDSYLMT